MSDRIGLKLCATTCVLLISPWPGNAATGPTSSVVANEPMTSFGVGRGPSSVDLLTRGEIVTSRVEPQGAEPAPEVFEPPPQEASRLGKPQGIYPGRPGIERGASSRNPLNGIGARTKEVIRIAAALAVVLGLLVFLRTIFRRMAGPLGNAARPSGVVDVLARYPIARGQQLVLLKLGRRIVLLHHGKAAMTMLSEISDPDETAALLARVEADSRRNRTGRFQALLNRFAEDGRASRDPGFSLRRLAGLDIEGNEVIDLTRRPRRARMSGSVARKGSL